MNKYTKFIEKEQISNFTFPESEVLKNKELIANRKRNILKGTKLGNLFKNKVHIFFEDSESLKKVDTTIWGFTEKHLILKRNMLIPISRIHSISF
jgi:hypothetical protein